MSTHTGALSLAGRRAPPLPIVGALSNWSVGKTLVAPAVIYAIIVTQLPFVLTVWYSLLRWNLLRPDNLQFAGIDNYLFVVAADPVFWSALISTIILTAGSVILALVVGLIYAELVNQRYPGRGIIRTMFITPFLVMPVVSALTWKNMMLNPVFGVVDYLMQLVKLPAVDWLAQFPLTAITGMVVWRWAPFMMRILLAGMQSLSEEIREAARVDGVSGIQEFRYIVLPHLNRFIQLGALLGSVYIVQEFNRIYMTTQGGPGHRRDRRRGLGARPHRLLPSALSRRHESQVGGGGGPAAAHLHPLAGLEPGAHGDATVHLQPDLCAYALAFRLIEGWRDTLFFFISTKFLPPVGIIVPLFMIGFVTSEGLFWAKLAAAGTMAMLPVVLVGWSAQRQLVRGLSLGAVK